METSIPTAPTTVEKMEELKVTILPRSSTADVIPTFNTRISALRSLLSERASVYIQNEEGFKESTERWSEYAKPMARGVVNVGCEEDICATIKWANEHKVPFLAQSGGHGFTSTVGALPSESVIINMRQLNSISITPPGAGEVEGTAVLGGGVLTGEVVEAAHAAGVHVVTGVCNTVGLTSALLGGGLGFLTSLYGLGLDNILSYRLITSKGTALTVSSTTHPDLFWALRGAGHNFGIVSQITVKAHPQLNNGSHFSGILFYPGTKENLLSILSAIKNLHFEAETRPVCCTLIWARIPPSFEPTLMLEIWYGGDASVGKEIFAPFYALNPVMDTTAMVPYTRINEGSDLACMKGGRKPVYSVGLHEHDILNVASGWESWVEWSGEEGKGQSCVLVECYPFAKVREMGGEKGEKTAYPWRERGLNVVCVPHYSDESVDAEAQKFGSAFRESIRGEGEKGIYVNFATGDEGVEELFGGMERVERLRKLKREWDPEGVFGWYNGKGLMD